MSLLTSLRSIIAIEAIRPRPAPPPSARGSARGHLQRGCSPETKRRIVCNFDPDVFERVVARAATADVTVTEMVRRLVARGLERSERKEPTP